MAYPFIVVPLTLSSCVCLRLLLRSYALNSQGYLQELHMHALDDMCHVHQTTNYMAMLKDATK